MDKKMARLVVVAALTIILLVVGYLLLNSRVIPTNTTALIPSAIAPGIYTITINDFLFNPDTITIASGSTVVWVNNDTVPHNVTGTTFVSPTIQPGGSYTFTFLQTGTFEYTCTIHPAMKGKITVQ